MTLRKLPSPVGIGYRSPSVTGRATTLRISTCSRSPWITASAAANRWPPRFSIWSGRFRLTTRIGLSIGTACRRPRLSRLGPHHRRSGCRRRPYSEHWPSLALRPPISLICRVAEDRRGRGGDHRQVRSINRASRAFLLGTSAICSNGRNSRMTDVEFLNLVCRETGAGLLLDVETPLLEFFTNPWI